MQVSLHCVAAELVALGYDDVRVFDWYVNANAKIGGDIVYGVTVFDHGLVCVSDRNEHQGRHKPTTFYTAQVHQYICLALNNR